jgi:hypothetical protein
VTRTWLLCDEDEADYSLPKASNGTLKDRQLKGIPREYHLPITVYSGTTHVSHCIFDSSNTWIIDG